jgi:DNA-binding CsgD family transcriptional regulator
MGPQERLVYSNPVGFFDNDDQATFEQSHRLSPWVLAAHTRATKDRPLRISDLQSQRQYHALPIYGDLFHALEIEHQSAYSFTNGHTLACVVLNRRGSDFSDCEIESLAALQRILGTSTHSFAHRYGVDSGDQPAPFDVPHAALTPRELVVLRIMSSGLTDVAIGRRRTISTRTDHEPLQHDAKLHVANRAEAAATWHGGHSSST